jgi:hypothetical protein
MMEVIMSEIAKIFKKYEYRMPSLIFVEVVRR